MFDRKIRFFAYTLNGKKGNKIKKCYRYRGQSGEKSFNDDLRRKKRKGKKPRKKVKEKRGSDKNKPSN